MLIFPVGRSEGGGGIWERKASVIFPPAGSSFQDCCIRLRELTPQRGTTRSMNRLVHSRGFPSEKRFLVSSSLVPWEVTEMAFLLLLI